MTFKSKLFIATTLVVGALSSGAHAYTPEQQQLCTDDAMRLCGEFIPDVDRITACMVQKRSQLSPGCKSVFHGPAPAPAPATNVNYSPATKPSKPLNITPSLRRG